MMGHVRGFLYAGDFADPDASIRGGDPGNLAKAVEHLLFGNKEQDTVANNRSGESVWQRNGVAQAFEHVQSEGTEGRNFIITCIQADSVLYAALESKVEEESVTAADVDKSISRLKRKFAEDPAIDELSGRSEGSSSS